MTDDFLLFDEQGQPPDGEPPIDPDVALISAYLARELSPVQVAAVERRLASDPEFADAVRPILDAWEAPIASPVESLRSGWPDASAPLVGAEELRAGWERHLAGVQVRPRRAHFIGMSPARAAALMAIVLLPAIGIAQVVIYVSRVDAPPGTSFGQKAIGLVRGTLKHRSQPVRPADAVGTETTARPTNAPDSQQPTILAPSVRTGADAQLPAIRPLGPIEARVSAVLKIGQIGPGSLPAIRQLSDGRVLLTDRTTLRLLLLDSTLTKAEVIDNPTVTNPTQQPDSARPRLARGGGTLFSLPGDSTLVVNFAATGFVVIGPRGEIGRTLPVARQPLVGSDVAIDRTGHFVFRVSTETAHRLPYPNDTLPLIRLGAESRIDTLEAGSLWPIGRGTYATPQALVAWLKVPPKRDLIHVDATPVPVNDDWTMMADGSIAVIRAADFHIDWFELDGNRHATAPIPYNWVSLTQSRKQRLIDSLQGYYKVHPVISLPELTIASIATLPDSVPPFSGYTAIGDLDLRVWIRVLSEGELPDAMGRTDSGERRVPNQIRSELTPLVSLRPPHGPPVYYVIDKRGTVVDRVQLPVGWRPLGFGSGDKVYLIREKPCVANGFPCQPGAEWEVVRARLR